MAYNPISAGSSFEPSTRQPSPDINCVGSKEVPCPCCHQATAAAILTLSCKLRLGVKAVSLVPVAVSRENKEAENVPGAAHANDVLESEARNLALGEISQHTPAFAPADVVGDRSIAADGNGATSPLLPRVNSRRRLSDSLFEKGFQSPASVDDTRRPSLYAFRGLRSMASSSAVTSGGSQIDNAPQVNRDGEGLSHETGPSYVTIPAEPGGDIRSMKYFPRSSSYEFFDILPAAASTGRRSEFEAADPLYSETSRGRRRISCSRRTTVSAGQAHPTITGFASSAFLLKHPRRRIDSHARQVLHRTRQAGVSLDKNGGAIFWNRDSDPSKLVRDSDDPALAEKGGKKLSASQMTEFCPAGPWPERLYHHNGSLLEGTASGPESMVTEDRQEQNMPGSSWRQSRCRFSTDDWTPTSTILVPELLGSPWTAGGGTDGIGSLTHERNAHWDREGIGRWGYDVCKRQSLESKGQLRRISRKLSSENESETQASYNSRSTSLEVTRVVRRDHRSCEIKRPRKTGVAGHMQRGIYYLWTLAARREKGIRATSPPPPAGSSLVMDQGFGEPAVKSNRRGNDRTTSSGNRRVQSPIKSTNSNVANIDLDATSVEEEREDTSASADGQGSQESCADLRQKHRSNSSSGLSDKSITSLPQRKRLSKAERWRCGRRRRLGKGDSDSDFDGSDRSLRLTPSASWWRPASLLQRDSESDGDGSASRGMTGGTCPAAEGMTAANVHSGMDERTVPSETADQLPTSSPSHRFSSRGTVSTSISSLVETVQCSSTKLLNERHSNARELPETTLTNELPDKTSGGVVHEGLGCLTACGEESIDHFLLQQCDQSGSGNSSKLFSELVVSEAPLSRDTGLPGQRITENLTSHQAVCSELLESPPHGTVGSAASLLHEGCDSPVDIPVLSTSPQKSGRRTGAFAIFQGRSRGSAAKNCSTSAPLPAIPSFSPLENDAEMFIGTEAVATSRPVKQPGGKRQPFWRAARTAPKDKIRSSRSTLSVIATALGSTLGSLAAQSTSPISSLREMDAIKHGESDSRKLNPRSRPFENMVSFASASKSGKSESRHLARLRSGPSSRRTSRSESPSRVSIVQCHLSPTASSSLGSNGGNQHHRAGSHICTSCLPFSSSRPQTLLHTHGLEFPFNSAAFHDYQRIASSNNVPASFQLAGQLADPLDREIDKLPSKLAENPRVSSGWYWWRRAPSRSASPPLPRDSDTSHVVEAKPPHSNPSSDCRTDGHSSHHSICIPAYASPRHPAVRRDVSILAADSAPMSLSRLVPSSMQHFVADGSSSFRSCHPPSVDASFPVPSDIGDDWTARTTTPSSPHESLSALLTCSSPLVDSAGTSQGIMPFFSRTGLKASVSHPQSTALPTCSPRGDRFRNDGAPLETLSLCPQVAIVPLRESTSRDQAESPIRAFTPANFPVRGVAHVRSSSAVVVGRSAVRGSVASTDTTLRSCSSRRYQCNLRELSFPRKQLYLKSLLDDDDEEEMQQITILNAEIPWASPIGLLDPEPKEGPQVLSHPPLALRKWRHGG